MAAGAFGSLVMTALIAVIHVFDKTKSWMAGTEAGHDG